MAQAAALGTGAFHQDAEVQTRALPPGVESRETHQVLGGPGVCASLTGRENETVLEAHVTFPSPQN